MTRRLWSENGPDCASMNLAEEAEIRKACDIVREALGLDVILVADSGFRRKDLLHWLKRDEGLDFVIRLEGKLAVFLDDMKVLLAEATGRWKRRATMLWRERSKRILLSEVSARRLTVVTEQREKVSFNGLCLTPVRDLVRIGRLYSWRVFSSWEAIDHLLAAALMAYLAMLLLSEFMRRGRSEAMRRLRRWADGILRTRFARPPVITQGRVMKLIAMDFPSPCLAGGLG